MLEVFDRQFTVVCLFIFLLVGKTTIHFSTEYCTLNIRLVTISRSRMYLLAGV